MKRKQRRDHTELKASPRTEQALYSSLQLSVNFTSMETVILTMLFIVSAAERFGKHVYVPHAIEWHEAQQYCRDNYTDLSPITSGRDERRLKNAAITKVKNKFWIGLYRNGKDWKWSGGGDATDIPWDADEPDDHVNQDVAAICWENCTWSGWHNVRNFRKLPFFCLDLIVIKFEKTWEQAMLYCKQTHTHLTSLSSETELLLALSKINQAHITEQVWIGLRYLGDRWVWVNKDPLQYQAWSPGDQDQQCPKHKRCGALTKRGVWENWDCQDKLHFICY